MPPTAMAADTVEKTPSGATYTAPKAWTLAIHPTFAVLAPPERDTHLAIVDVTAAKSPTDAAAQAWTIYRPEARRHVKLITPRPPRQGWDERAVVAYEISPNEKAEVDAAALRKGTRWTVVVIDASQATFEKRAAAVNLVVQSLRAPGYRRELFTGRMAHRLDPARLAALKSFVQTAMRELGVPGAGMAVVDHGRVVFEGGFGVRELGKPAPVDAHTRFMIASNTKGMTTLLLAKLVDEGKLAWDEPVVKAYPDFRLGSADTTRRVLMRHLVCACTGLPRKDLDWLFNTQPGTPASATFVQLAGTEPTSGFGEVFQYNNLMAAAAGYIAGRIVYPDVEVGAAYDRAMQALIFDPLQMEDTGFDYARALVADHATPHADDIDGTPRVASMALNYVAIPYRPAGAAWSSPHDVIHYVQDELSEGKLPDGRQFVSAKNLLARRAPSVPTGEDGWYGMGPEVDKSWGVAVIHHGGSLAGFKSDWVAIPDARVGAVLLTNSDDGQLMLRPFMRRLLEILYDGKPEAAGDVEAAAARNKAEIRKDRERLVVPAIAAKLADAYSNRDLGHIAVTRDAKGVRFDFGPWKSSVASRRNDDGTISLITIDPSVTGFEFVMGSRDGRRTLTIRDGQHEYVYGES